MVSLLRRSQLPSGGPERYTTRRVVFVHPFSLGNAPEVYPAGTYEVETKEESVERGGYTAHVRTATVLIIPTAAGTCHRPVQGGELDQALMHDSEHSVQAGPSENPDRGKADPHATTGAG